MGTAEVPLSAPAPDAIGAQIHAELDRLRGELAAAQERETRVRALHTHGTLDAQDGKPAREVCDVCTNDEGTWESWPCPTIAALADPGQPSGETP